MTRYLLPLFFALLAACQQASVQTSSGAAFAADRGRITDAAVARAALGEPDLAFPARIGVARIIGRDLTRIPEAELAMLAELRPNPDPIGQFVPVSPLIAKTLSRAGSVDATRTAQLTAARQHLDYVLITVFTRDGAGFETIGRAETILMDVRSGYVYGHTAVETSVVGYGAIRKGWRNWVLSDRAAAKVTQTLAPSVNDMLTQLVQRGT